jgi:predicted site-specific integrase-resolvase
LRTVTTWAKAGIIPSEVHEGRLYRFDEVKVSEALRERANKTR